MNRIIVNGFSGLSDCRDWEQQELSEIRPKFRLLQGAHDYVSMLPWVKKCMGFWPGIIIPDFVGVFLYKIVQKKSDIPDYHWIIVGPRWPYAVLDENRVDQNEIRNRTYSGLPHAYIWTGHPDFSDDDAAPNPACALDSYISVIGAWVKAIQSNDDLSNVFPVYVPPEKTALVYANDLVPLLERIEAEILPNYADDLKAVGSRSE